MRNYRQLYRQFFGLFSALQTPTTPIHTLFIPAISSCVKNCHGLSQGNTKQQQRQNLHFQKSPCVSKDGWGVGLGRGDRKKKTRPACVLAVDG